MGGVASAIGDAVGGVVKAAGKAVETVAKQITKDPLSIVAMVAAPQLAPAIAQKFAVSQVVAKAVSAAAVSGIKTAVQGGDFGDIIKSASASGFGSFVGNKVGSAVNDFSGSATQAAIAGGAAGAATGTLIATGDIETALKQGIIGGAVGGTEKTIQKAFSPTGKDVAQAETPTAATRQAGETVQVYPSGGGFGNAVTETVSKTSPYGTMTYDTMPSMQAPTFFEKTVKSLSEPAQELGGQLVESKLSEVLGLTPTGAGSGGIQAPTATFAGAGTSGATTTGSAALAQALRIADPGAPLFGSEGTGQRQNVWNTESLRVKDETGS